MQINVYKLLSQNLDKYKLNNTVKELKYQIIILSDCCININYKNCANSFFLNFGFIEEINTLLPNGMI